MRKDALSIKNVTLGYILCLNHSRHLLQRTNRMGIISKFFGKFLGGRIPTYIVSPSNSSDLPLSEEGAMKVATVYSCVRIIAEDVGTLPIHVKMRSEDGKRMTLYTHPVARVLNRPNPFMSGIDFRRAMIASLELHGNAYAIITERDKRGYPTRIDFADATQMTVIVGENDIFYAYGENEDLLPSRDVIHLKGYAPDGIEGKSPIKLHRDTIENAVNATKFSKKLYKNDLRSTAVFSLEGELSPDAYARTKSQLQEMYKKATARTDVPLVLEGGTKVNALTITPEDAQFIATKLQNIDEIAAIFRVPPHKVGDWTRGTYSNNTQANLEYFTDCIRPLLEIIEEELSRKLFLEVEQGSHYIDINFKGLLRTDTKTQIENYRTLFNIGVYSANDIRAMEDLAPYDGGDRYFVPVNMAINDNTLKTNE